ncbi:hypothetical protein MMC30_003244 [Trapelia coarctata]|nr:hypothetical protein [Trapelia coarctata]
MASTPRILPTYDCSQDQGTKALVVASVLLGIAIVTVIARLYVRIVMRRSLGWDDYLIIASSLIGITAFATYVKCIQAGMGRHLLCLTLERIADVAKWSLISQILISVNLGLTKVSVIIFVMRVIDKAKKRLTQLLWVLIAFIIISHLVQFLLFCLQCRPIQGVWNPFVKSTCFSTRVTYLSAYINYSLDCFADLLCVAVAIYVIQRLQMNIQTKIALCCLMGLGLFTAACVIVDAVTLQGGITQPAMWAAVGAFVGITIASVPVLKPLFSKVFEIATMHTGSSKSTFRKFSGRDEKGQPPHPPVSIKKNATRRHDLESYDTDATLTQNSNHSRSAPELDDGLPFDGYNHLRPPPGAYYPNKGTVRF